MIIQPFFDYQPFYDHPLGWLIEELVKMDMYRAYSNGQATEDELAEEAQRVWGLRVFFSKK